MAKPSLPENRFYVYILRRPDKVDPFDEGKGCPFYIGKGCNGAKDRHRWQALQPESKRALQNRAKINVIRYLWDLGLDYETELHKDKLTEREAFNLEVELITNYGQKYNGGILTNQTNGGDGKAGWKASEETKKRQSKALRGRKASFELRKKLSEVHKGIQAGEKHPQYGKKMPDHVKQKLAEANRKRKGGHFAPEHCKKISIALMGNKCSAGRILTEDHKNNLSISLKGKIMEHRFHPIEINNVKYRSIKDAAKDLNITECALRGRIKRNTIKFISLKEGK